jgi:hypothetical protein
MTRRRRKPMSACPLRRRLDARPIPHHERSIVLPSGREYPPDRTETPLVQSQRQKHARWIFCIRGLLSRAKRSAGASFRRHGTHPIDLRRRRSSCLMKAWLNFFFEHSLESLQLCRCASWPQDYSREARGTESSSSSAVAGRQSASSLAPLRRASAYFTCLRCRRT